MKTQSIIVVIWCFLMPLSLWSQVKVDTDGNLIVGPSKKIIIPGSTTSTTDALRIYRQNQNTYISNIGSSPESGFRISNSGAVHLGPDDMHLASRLCVIPTGHRVGVSAICLPTYTINELYQAVTGEDMCINFAGYTYSWNIQSKYRTFYVTGGGEVFSTNNLILSDISMKEEIETIEGPLDKVMKLRGVTFESKLGRKKELKLSDFVVENGDSNLTQDLITQMNSERSRKHMGVVAQEVEEVVPEVVRTTLNGTKAVAYTELVGLLIEAIKEQQSQIEELKAQVFSQESTNPVRNLRSVSDKDALSISSDVAVKNMLYQNVPNPFTSDTKIRYTLSEDVVNANLYIYNMQGTQIKNISGLSGGAGVITINGRELKAGMYIYTLIADGKEVDTKRMILTD